MIAFLMIFVLSVAGLPMQGKETAALTVVEKDSETGCSKGEVSKWGYQSNKQKYSNRTTILKSYLKKGLAKEVALSKLQLAYSGYHKAVDPLNLTEEDVFHTQTKSNDIFDIGGNEYNAAVILARWQGAVNEEDAPYSMLQKDKEPISLPQELMYQRDSYHLQNAEFVYTSIPNRLKELALEKGCGNVLESFSVIGWVG